MSDSVRTDLCKPVNVVREALGQIRTRRGRVEGLAEVDQIHRHDPLNLTDLLADVQTLDQRANVGHKPDTAGRYHGDT